VSEPNERRLHIPLALAEPWTDDEAELVAALQPPVQMCNGGRLTPNLIRLREGTWTRVDGRWVKQREGQ
jgi:hypothetical protein